MALQFPSTLSTSGANYIKFIAKDKSGSSQGEVALYMPPGVSFSDGAGYSTFDMGPLGNQIAARMAGGLNTDSAIGLGKDMAQRVSANQDLRTIMAGKMIQNAAAVPGLDKAGEIYQKSKSIAVNPNTVTSFQNMNIRSFVFNFKLVPDNMTDSATIKKIQNMFREFMYADTAGQGYLLSYPYKWDIRFINGNTHKENPYYPKIYECYLTNLQTSYQGSGHLHHRDGAPTEVDVSLTFQETKVLTKDDIRGLL